MHGDAVLLRTIGFALVAAVCFDIFHTIIVPRPTLNRARIAPVLVGTVMWIPFKRLVGYLPQRWRTGWLEMFAPVAFVVLLMVWLTLMVGGFSLVILSLGQYVQPPVNQFSEAFYFAGTSVLTLGFGDVVATDWSVRMVVLLAALLGLITMALVVSLLFSILSYLQQREQVVNTLMSRAGLPPSGVVLLMRYSELGIIASLSTSFVTWESWLASILESHRVFPLLMYFRSSSMNNSWLATAGATLDAANLLLTSIEDHSIGEADLYYWMGVNALKAVAEAFRIEPVDSISIDRAELADALSLLKDAGYKTKDLDKIWPYFSARRSGYIRHLIPLAQHFESPVHSWIPVFGQKGAR